ncbi:unnamed protein product [Rotaria socialis]|uniref:EamA domain-containing protein n=3 Tax=Rotaria socialis TaxID=392032 RepID=A0A818JFH4_9BILA|nr:unnamed protein product [Rotaria socialis]
MTHEAFTIEKNILIDNITSATIIPTENDNININNIDPLIEPLIDADELEEAVHNDETLHRIERQFSSILSLKSRKQTPTKSSPEIIGRCTGIVFALIASCFFTCSSFIIKQLRVDFFDALLIRFFLQTGIILAFILYKKNKFINGSTNLIILQIVRAIIAVSGLLLFFWSYHYIPLPDLTTCRYTQVVWTAIIAMIIFRERISISTVLAIIFTLTGVVLVAQPTFFFGNHQVFSNASKVEMNKSNTTNFDLEKSNRLLGLCLALGCAVSISLSIVINKKLLVSKIPQSIIMLQFSLLNLAVLFLNHMYNRLILHKYADRTMFTWQFFLAASVSLFQVISSTLTYRAIKLEHPSIISIVQSSDILFAIALQNLFTNQKSNWFVLFGSLLVTTSIFLVGVPKFLLSRKQSLENKRNSSKL